VYFASENRSNAHRENPYDRNPVNPIAHGAGINVSTGIDVRNSSRYQEQPEPELTQTQQPDTNVINGIRSNQLSQPSQKIQSAQHQPFQMPKH
jgi:hypothetical protein